MIFRSNVLRDPDPPAPTGGGGPPVEKPKVATSADTVDKSEHVRVSKRLKQIEQDFATHKEKVGGIEKAQGEMAKILEVFQKAPPEKKSEPGFLSSILDECTKILLGN